MQLKPIKWHFPFLLLLLIFVWATHFNGLYGQDSYEYLRYTKCIKEFICRGVNPGDCYWPVLYPITGAIFSFLIPLPFALQLISIVALILTSIYLEKILVLIFQPERNSATLYLFLFLLLSPYVLRASLVIMPDSLTILWIVAGAYNFEKYKRTLVSKYFLYLICFFTAAVSTRYAAFIVVLPFCAIAVFIFLRNFKISTLFISLFVVFLLTLPYILINKESPLRLIHHEWFNNWSPINLVRNHFNTSEGHSSYFWDNIVYSFFNVLHPAFCFAGIILILACLNLGYKKWKSPGIAPYTISVLLYAIFMAGIPFQDMRYLLLPFPFILIVLFSGYKSIEQSVKNGSSWRYIILVTVIIQLALFCRVFIPFYTDNKEGKYVSTQMLKYSDRTLYTFSIDGALKNYGFTGKIVNMYEVRIDTMKRIDSNFYVLFNLSQFSEEWKEENPMKNWEFLNTHYNLVEQEDMSRGWKLYYSKPISK